MNHMCLNFPLDRFGRILGVIAEELEDSNSYDHCRDLELNSTDLLDERK